MAKEARSHGGERVEELTEGDKLTGKITACAREVHRQLGPGLLESIYQSALTVELEFAGIAFQRPVVIPNAYRSKVIGEPRLDLIVEKAVVLELKSVKQFDPVFEAQLPPYLRITGMRVGLLINFNSRLLRAGIKGFILLLFFAL